TLEPDPNRLIRHPLHLLRGCAENHLNPILLEELQDLRSDIRVFAPQKCLVAVDERHLAAKAAKHLRKLTANIATTDYDEMLRQLIEFLDRFAVERAAIGKPGYRRQVGPRSGVDHDLVATYLA